MKFILEGSAQDKPAALGIINEDMLINPQLANEKLSQYNLKIEKIEIVNGEKVIYIKEANSNLLNG